MNKIKSTPISAICAATNVGDLVCLVRSQPWCHLRGVVIEARPRASLVRWSDGDCVRSENAALRVIAKGEIDEE